MSQDVNDRSKCRRHGGGSVVKRRASSGSQLGFTLLEVVVALAVVAVALSAIIQTTGGFISNQAYLRDKTMAHWVARNALTEWRLSRDWPTLGEHTGSVEFGKHEWDWSIQVIQTDEEDMRRLDVEVRPLSAEGNPLAVLSGFVKQPK